MKKLIKLMGLMLIAIMLVGCAKPDDEPKNEEADVNVLIQAVYSENPNWTESWTVGLPSGENTKWKATEIWFYSNKKLAYTSNFDSNKNALAIKLQEKIPGCVLYINKVDKKTYNGWIPYESDYALCIGLQSKNCNIQNVWCETIETSLLKEVYDIMINSGRDFITNYKN